jgi:hypothetical protein
MPYLKTKIIGVSLAKMIDLNTSINGLHPWMMLTNPTPSAMTSGTVTVTVDVVTPSES